MADELTEKPRRPIRTLVRWGLVGCLVSVAWAAVLADWNRQPSKLDDKVVGGVLWDSHRTLDVDWRLQGYLAPWFPWGRTFPELSGGFPHITILNYEAENGLLHAAVVYPNLAWLGLLGLIPGSLTTAGLWFLVRWRRKKRGGDAAG